LNHNISSKSRIWGSIVHSRIYCPHFWEREGRRKQSLDDGINLGSTGTLAVNSLGPAGLKEGSVVDVGEQSPQEEEPNYKKMQRAGTFGIEETVIQR
jgi:hypothetical protein